VEEFVGHFKKQNTQPCGHSIGFFSKKSYESQVGKNEK
jgi:hypothetical protein